jgi:PhnB protein
MQIVPYLWFNGACAEAFSFYEKVLGGKIVDLLPHAGTPRHRRVALPGARADRAGLGHRDS